jgi:hypothetical protein
MSRRVPVTETQWAHPADAFSTEASVGRGKGSGVSLTMCAVERRCKINSREKNQERSSLIRGSPHYPMLP